MFLIITASGYRASGLFPAKFASSHVQKFPLKSITFYSSFMDPNRLPKYFENNDQTFTVDYTKKEVLLTSKEVHKNHDGHHAQHEHDPNVYHFEINSPADVHLSHNI